MDGRCTLVIRTEQGVWPVSSANDEAKSKRGGYLLLGTSVPTVKLAKCLSTFNLHRSAQTKVVEVNATPASQGRLLAPPRMSLGLMLTTPSFDSSLHTQLGSPNSLSNWSEFDLSGVP